MCIAGLQPRDKAATLDNNTAEFILQEKFFMIIQFTEERNAFVVSSNIADVTSRANQQYTKTITRQRRS